MSKAKQKEINEIMKKIHTPKVKGYLQEKGIEHLSLFGSYAKGEHNVKSDIDFLFKEKKNVLLSLFDLVEIAYFLRKILRKKVDLVDITSLHRRIKASVLADRIPILQYKKTLS